MSRVNCPGCQRDNAPARRYCGGCGCNFDPACAACGFANEPRDRFCGGCGAGLRAGVRVSAASASVASAVNANVASANVSAVESAPAPRRAAQATQSPWAAAELAELFQPAAPVDDGPSLPEVGIRQSDVDRLFGDVP